MSPNKSGPAKGQKYTMGEAVCAGTCGRMTRSKHMTAAEHPNTVTRRGHGMCSPCYQPILDAQRDSRTELKYPILPCTAKGCTAMTRSTRDSAELAPGTRRRVSKGRCSECVKKLGADIPEAQFRVVQSELEGFLAARRRRAEKQARRFAVAS